MQVHHSIEARQLATVPQQAFADLLTENRPTVDTATAAHWLSRKPQTLRIWSLTGHPIAPRRVNGRLAWPVSEIKKLLGVA